jgi:segregation and condensation protein B
MGEGETELMGTVAEMRVIVSNEGRDGRDEHEVRPEELRILEALLFAAEEPLDEKVLGARLPAGIDVRSLLLRLQEEYAPRGVNLVRVGGKWSLRTASDLCSRANRWSRESFRAPPSRRWPSSPTISR